MSFSACFLAASASASVLVCVWPLAPIRPKRTVAVLSLVVISQNLAELPLNELEIALHCVFLASVLDLVGMRRTLHGRGHMGRRRVGPQPHEGREPGHAAVR